MLSGRDLKNDPRDLERERLKAQYAEIASLAGGLAHEIKNPLSTISMNLELLLEDLEGEDSPRDRRINTKLQTVQKECHRLEEILNDFLQFARVGELNLACVQLNDVVSEFIDFFQAKAAEKNIEISPHLNSDLPSVLLDTALFRQVLMNLVLNAQQSMSTGGLLEMQTYTKENQVCLDLIDNGSGIPETSRAKIFQVFFSTKSSGSGLGLPTVKKIIEAHQGVIECESVLGKGTRFTISLPAADE